MEKSEQEDTSERMLAPVHILLPVGTQWYKRTTLSSPLREDFKFFWELLEPNALAGCSYWSREKGLEKEFEKLNSPASTPCILSVDRTKKTTTKVTEKNFFELLSTPIPDNHAIVLTTTDVSIEKICSLLDDETQSY